MDDQLNLPFHTMSFGSVKYKVTGMVTKREIAGYELIWWYRKRCGKSEEPHSVMKEDLAGGKLSSGLFAANAAWWHIMILALNLNSAMSRLVLGEELGEQAAQGHTVFVDKPSGSCSRSCEIPDCSTDRGTSIQRDTL